ncbi:ribosome small subunit-dependent GTPase A [Spirochaeta isovalerica]|uniref:Small ribosomal subunit biogenesis GTPase RsgA n=1 Tax=Spirochaeta isovalerica TaxID=150 RepID=A0A841R7N4_9SPIO|nr:ribosome small subunit-dependent GTPase A [Spirochaeta isovalerica]MBB6478502.1 ribosome biogenesis GTPase [Spirochaeta isovalerica]
MSLEKWGWDSTFRNHYEPYREQGLIPGRVIGESRHIYEIATSEDRLSCRVSGHYMYTAANRSEYPTIGDWVLLRFSEGGAVIEKLLPRKSTFSRKRAGVETEEQVIAANADYIFLVFGLDGGRNFSRGALERFLTRSWDSGATPVIILNKVDLCEDRESFYIEAESVSSGASVYMTSAVTGEGLESLDAYLKEGKTVAFTGFSGVGKSALINSLAGKEIMKTGTQRENDLRGRHTTTTKSLIQLESGAILIDSPGIKELQLWGTEESLDNAFSDIAEISEQCRFSDCTHSGEPGCAVQEALSTGELDHSRFENYLDLQRELRFLERKQDARQALEEKAKWKKIAKLQKSLNHIRKSSH